MKRQIVILANSFRESARCIAGIDIATGEWIRPVLVEGAITWSVRNIDGREPELLEIVEISVQGDGPDLGCQPENRLVNNVPWKPISIIPVRDVLKYCESDKIILHNDDDSIEANYFETIPKQQWKSLQLIHPVNTKFSSTSWEGKKKWRGIFQYSVNKHLNLGLTDPILIERLNRDEEISQDCLLTISLGGPWSRDGIQPKRCYKLIAGVIEL